LASLIRDTKIRTRFERELKEAEREGSEEGVEERDGQAAEEGTNEEGVDEMGREREVAVEAARREEALEAWGWLQEMFGDEPGEMNGVGCTRRELRIVGDV
jgi:hypothetical protein